MPTSRLFLMSERFPTTLHHFLQRLFGRGGRLHVRTIEALLVPIVQGLRQMHIENFAHCGLREDSIFLTEGLYPILSEFESKAFCTSEQTEGSLQALIHHDDGYTPIELLGKGTKPEDLDLKKVDSYSVGVILVHMLAGKKDYARVKPGELPHIAEPSKQEEKGPFSRLVDLASRLISYWPNRRPLLAEVVKE